MVTLIAELGSRPAQRVLQALASWTGDVRREVVIDEKRSRGQRLDQDSRFSSSSSSSTSPSASAPALYFPRTHVGGNCPVVTDGHNFPSPSPPPRPQSQPNLLPTTSNPPKDHIQSSSPRFPLSGPCLSNSLTHMFANDSMARRWCTPSALSKTLQYKNFVAPNARTCIIQNMNATQKRAVSLLWPEKMWTCQNTITWGYFQCCFTSRARELIP